MFTALTKDNKRISIEEAVPGETYYCPVCRNLVAVRAANSNNVRTHFAHKRNCLCFDDWKHDMSDWHFEWQSKFPIESREVVVEKDGVVHRADILINDTVIEFQHSPISGEEFESRNNFYKSRGYRVVWLFDATDKMKIDECFGLVWKRETKRFSCMRTWIDAVYVQNYLPDKNDLLLLRELDPKEVRHYKPIYPILPENFLKEYGAIQDENIMSIQTIFEQTREYFDEQKRKEAALAKIRYDLNARSLRNQIVSSNNRRYRRF